MLSLFEIAFSQRGKAPVISGQRIENLNLDGTLDDWPLEAIHFDEKKELSYGIANDKEHLFLGIRTKKLGKVKLGGVKFVIESIKGKRASESRTILSPVPQKKEDAEKAFEQIKVFGFPEITDSILSIYNEHGIQMAYHLDENTELLTMEFAIPLSLLPDFFADSTLFDFQIILEGFKVSPQMFAALASSTTKTPEGRVVKLDPEELNLYTEDKVVGRYQLSVPEK
ncbi:hypothetical protein M472_15430 [Sphingobacterium paucimobilis HER1398]|uniref:Uncharacterized protein n=2 Tax=Sphingobacterium TaxID=28453 RepID=U2J5F1_9SPHI|nr:hypothetical protein M472_15430 [Sphingobacterium paucimobilis HER1398]